MSMGTKLAVWGLLFFPSISFAALRRGLGGSNPGGGGGGGSSMHGSMQGNGGPDPLIPCPGNRRRRTEKLVHPEPKYSRELESRRRILSELGRPTQNPTQNPAADSYGNEDGLEFIEWTDDSNSTFWLDDWNYTESDGNYTGFTGDRPIDPDGDKEDLFEDPFGNCDDDDEEEYQLDDDDDDSTSADDDNITQSYPTASPNAINVSFTVNTQAPVISPGEAPSLPPEPSTDTNSQFLDPNIRSTIYCYVSTAMPVYPNSHFDLEKQQAERLLVKVALVIGEILLLESRDEIKTIVDTDIPILDAIKDRGKSRSLRPRKELRYNYVISNVTQIGMDNSTPSHESWWLHSVAFDTIEHNATEMQQFMDEVISESLESRKFEEILRRYFKRLIAARRPGFEALTMDDDYETPSPTLPPTNNELQVDRWDIRQWFGLGMFSFTLILLMALTQTAQQRRKKLKEEEEWGIKLGSDQAVEQLLTYGWKQDGSRVNIYDKKKLGYTDDDSILLGGVQPDMTLPSSGNSSNGLLTLQKVATTVTSSSGRQSKILDASQSGLSGFHDKVNDSQSDLSNSAESENNSVLSATLSGEQPPRSQDNPQDSSN